MARYFAVPMLLAVSAILFVLCAGQLTFSPGWGKRSLGLNGGAPATPGDACKSSLDSLMLIYRLIQNEAQKLIECSEK